ncbi:MAG: glycosyltransferase [Bacteroidales bacterium]|nr:glycosyltransferase [Bacteroidales bacterium]
MVENLTTRRLVFISKSDLRGGAAIVTFRLVQALRAEGHDARMLVCEKLSDAPFVELCAPQWKIKAEFIKERLRVMRRNGFNRSTLFKIDPASHGLPLWQHPWVKEADAVFLGWVCQGMLSLRGIRKICGLGKPVVWIMHDMWNMTGICHHAGDCTGYLHSCGDCPLLGDKASDSDLSRTTWENKRFTYENTTLRFVAVSNWLAGKARESGLLRHHDVAVVPNAFDIESEAEQFRTHTDDDELSARPDGPIRIIYGGARLDDPIKGLPVLKKALKIISDRYPEIAADMQLVTFGAFKDPESNAGFSIAHTHLGMLHGNSEIRRAYRGCGIVVSTSDYETLPGTLVEGQAYGCIPVATDHGGQGDIIDHHLTGWLAPWNDEPGIRAEEIAKGLIWAYKICRSDRIDAMCRRMKQSVCDRFSAPEVARRILSLIQDCPTTT